MASIVRRPNGCREIRFELASHARKTVRLGRCDQKTAAGVRVHVERLVAAGMSNTPAPPDTLCWLHNIPDKLYGRLARVGLCGPREPDNGQVLALKHLCDAYRARRSDWQPGTALVFGQATKHLTEFFGANRRTDTISIGEAKDFRRSMAARYSEAYVSKLIRQARQLWRDAVDRKLLVENPWSSVRLGSDRNPSRQRYIDCATIDKVIAITMDKQWQLLIALARYGGLRVPSEPLALRWSDINLDTGRMTVRSKKTRRYAGRDTRVVPVFPSLQPYLRAVLDERGGEQPAGESWVITRYRESNANLRTQFLRFIDRAGVARWPRLFQNLRASCEADWVERFPAHVVCAWIGHNEVVARNHYLQVTEAHYKAAVASDELRPGGGDGTQAA